MTIPTFVLWGSIIVALTFLVLDLAHENQRLRRRIRSAEIERRATEIDRMFLVAKMRRDGDYVGKHDEPEVQVHG